MSTKWDLLLTRWLSCLLAIAVLLATPAFADDDDDDDDGGSKSQARCVSNLRAAVKRWKLKRLQKGKINPSSILILDGDLDDMALEQKAVKNQIEAGAAHAAATGDGIVVAVLDGGFNLDHPSLDGNVSAFAYDAIDDDSDPNDGGNGKDDDGDGVTDRGIGHGTAVAGMVLLAAPDATILPIRVSDDEGYASIYDFETGLAYAIDLGVDVINISLRIPWMDREIRALLREAREDGIVVVASAGNDGQKGLGMLAARKDTISVGAVDEDDVVAKFSNEEDTNEDLTVYAPGVKLWCPLGWPNDESVGLCSGTSFAAGIVSGAAAVYRELYPTASVGTVRGVIADSVDPAYDTKGMVRSDAGRINLRKVVSR
jgi:subtilisin family serine protease